LAPRLPRLKQSLLAVLIATGPLHAVAQGTPAPAEKLEISHTAPAPLQTSDDPLLLWFREQDRILDDILLRLVRIETLVSQIHRLIAQLPDAAQTKPPLPPAVAVATPVVPSLEAQAEPSGISSLTGWLPYLIGAALSALVLLRLVKRRRPAAPRREIEARPASESVSQASTIGIVAPVVPATTAPTHHHVPDGGQADQALELAEIMLSMGLGHGAAQTLVEQIRQEPKQALRHWLKLLEIYRANGQREEFEKSAEDLRQHFNVRPEDWQAPRQTYASLEDYPHIATRLTETWRKGGCLGYMQGLLNDNRGGARAGFPQAVAEELLLLVAIRRAGGLT
jgi:hypothetical protein